ncbi:vacuolar protein [Cryptococcus neoformans c8]|nr:vacuolar protein [Cryptococcus neoformans var. grubii AD1-83a]OXG53743.1 vacuolar protein [Cryptococcus neoformans var. grubii MW-RSA1955]OXG57133.1 vacuolar protein [Cryptococcus neoformans var. grubii CHC193]OXG60524.1 vacuolar protein [Cryptococcus neoformans var. grubii c8]OXH06482.1 vacuolar protein [Cryptococcus neoformans var. grubii A5-35-17]OXH07561.1 vacuolar protein [Cryptococcus neoformans var. grubii A1-35-8]
MSSDKSTRPAKPVEIPRSAPSSSGLSFRAFFPLFGLLVVLIYQNYPGISSTIITRLSGNASLADRPAPGQLAIVEQDVHLPDSARCPIQPEPLNVGEDWNPLEDSVYSNLAAKRLSKAVQIDTVAYDDMPMDTTDPAFDKHFVFARFIEHEYPKLILDLKHEVINNHGHLFTWEGSNPNLKPIMLMAHIDTVPVPPETLGQWKYLPFEGAITQDGTPDTPGTWIWGRGSSDCKNSLLGIYGAVERLISEGYKPERTVIISNGFDEEVGGARGAAAIAKVLEERYGKHGVAFLVDEGVTGILEYYGASVALFGMAEKGSVNVKVKIESLGGHSSVPPRHTGIGVISRILTKLEDNPFPPILTPETPFFKFLACMSEYAPLVPEFIKTKIKHPKEWSMLAHGLAARDRILNSFLATTQAIDLISGGVKYNALPEYTEATINHRIAFTSSINETLQHIVDLIVPVAQSLNFTISPFDGSPKTSDFHISLEAPYSLEPAPITPSDSKSFELMAGTTKHVFGKETIVSPSGMFANTDTKRMWNVTKNIYRFSPALVTESVGMHTVNERISLNAHLTTTRFFYKLIRNSEGWVNDDG